jgi:hypothetical protein
MFALGSTQPKSSNGRRLFVSMKRLEAGKFLTRSGEKAWIRGVMQSACAVVSATSDRIVETGAHRELLLANKTYRQTYEIRFNARESRS